MLVKKYREIEKGIVIFWKNYYTFSEEASRYNQEEDSCISTEYYFYTQVAGLSGKDFGNIGTLSLAPYLTNSQIMAIINEDKNSLIYPSSDEEWIIKRIMSYDI